MSSSETKQPFFNDDGTVAVDCVFVEPNDIVYIVDTYRAEFEIDSKTPLKIEEIAESLLSGPAVQALINLKKGGRDLFKGYSGTSVDLSSAGLSEVRFEGSLHEMFMEAKSLTVAPKFDTSRIQSVESMFYKCYKLTVVPPYDLKNCTNFKYMFKYCQALAESPDIDVSGAVEPDSLKQMFYGCTNLRRVRLKNIRASLQIGGVKDDLSKRDWGTATGFSYMADLANQLVPNRSATKCVLTVHPTMYGALQRVYGIVMPDDGLEPTAGPTRFKYTGAIAAPDDYIPSGTMRLLDYIVLDRDWEVASA